MKEMFFIKKIECVHSDERRDLFELFNKKSLGFIPKQIKIINIKKDSILGNHYHKYKEFFYIMKGSAIYYLVDVKNKNNKVTVGLTKGDILVINKNIAHKVDMKKGTITIEGTEKAYVNAKKNDVKYEI